METKVPSPNQPVGDGRRNWPISGWRRTSPFHWWRKHEGAAMRALEALRRALRNDDGQGLAEYALILALIAIVAIIALIFLGGQVSAILSTVGGSV
jgi:pilus assembly protein Flp/PilA